jgi:hypothetical protein
MPLSNLDKKRIAREATAEAVCLELQKWISLDPTEAEQEVLQRTILAYFEQAKTKIES